METLPRPVFARAKSLPRGARNPWHVHPWAQLTYAIKGVLVVRTVHGTFLTPPQWAVWIPPGVHHEVITSVRTERRNFFIDPTKIAWDPATCRVLEVSPFMRELIRVVAALPTEYDEEGRDGRLVQVLLDQIPLLREAEFSLPMPSTPSLLEFCTELLHRSDDHRPVRDVAKASGMSERTMSRVFLRETGVSFRDWRVRLKLMMSIEMLEVSKNVTGTAFDCGYDSTSAFITAFKHQFGRTPGDFLKSLDV
jgi:AraC-like DNA-binding protein